MRIFAAAGLIERWQSQPAANSTSSSRMAYVTPLAPVIATTMLRFMDHLVVPTYKVATPNVKR